MIKIPGNKLICVDIQPSYEKYISFLNELLFALNDFEGEILYLFNGPEQGYESEQELKYWLIDRQIVLGIIDENGENDELIDRINFVEKSYGFLRDVIDEGYVDETIKLTRYMLKHDINDSRDIDIHIMKRFKIDDELKEKLIHGSLALQLPEFDQRVLMQYDNCTLIGGGENECLLEIEVLMKAMILKYKRFNQFIY